LVLPAALLALAACGARPLLGEVTLSAPELHATGAGETVRISYAIARPASVTVYLEAAAGARYVLRQDEPRQASSESHTLPSGSYTVVVEAAAADGERAKRELPLTIVAADAPLPQIENLVAYPTTISPNADAIDDVAEITFRPVVTATVDIEIIGPGCNPL